MSGAGPATASASAPGSATASASAPRFRPNRLGLVSIAEYIDEVFAFAGGRLVLQGHNGAGKSKALELSIPLLFSGETRPRTLDTFGGQSKRLKDIVLWSDSPKQTFVQRTGWVWLELALTGGDGEPPRHVTLGAGMHAHRDWQDVRTRFFILDGPRVGSDVRLAMDSNVVTFPHLREALGEDRSEIGGAGAQGGPQARIFEGAAEFRRAQDELLFGFGDEERYQVMLRLLLALRRPNLSENMRPETIEELLRETLPPVDASLIGRIGALLEELERIGEEQREAEQSAEAVRAMHEDYRLLAASIARERAAALRGAAERRRRAERAHDDAREEHARRRSALADARDRGEQAEHDHADVDARLRELRESEQATAARDLQRRGEALERARANVRSLREGATAQEQAALRAHEELEETRAETDSELAALQSAAGEAGEDASAAGIEGHEAAVAQAGEDHRRLLAGLRALTEDRRARLREQRALDSASRDARIRRDGALATRDQLDAELRARVEAHVEADRAAEVAAHAHVSGVERWISTAPTLVHDGQASELLGLASADGGEESPGRAWAAARAAAAGAEVERRIAAAHERTLTLEREREQVASEHARLAAARDPDVAPPPWRARDMAAPGGTPLWRLLEFREDFAGEQRRGGLEGALHASGLLDALLADDGVIWREGDVLLVPAPLSGQGVRTLADALRPDDDCDERRAGRVAELLRSVALGSDGSASVWCAPDGRFLLGPAHGQNELPAPALIGTAARERLRAAQLAELERLLEDLRGRIEIEQDAVRACESELEAIANALERYPSPAALRAAVREAQALARREREAVESLGRAQALLEQAERERSGAEELAGEHRSVHAVPHDLDAHADAIEDYARSGERLAVALRDSAAARERFAQAERRAEQAQGERERAERAAHDAERETDAEASALAEARAAAGQEPAEVLARIEELGRAERDARSRVAGLRKEVEAAIGEEARAEEHEKTAASDAGNAREAMVSHERALRGLGGADFLRLVLDEEAPPDAQSAGGWTAERCLELAKLVLERAPSPEGARSQLAARFDNAHVRLKEALAAHRRVRVFLDRSEDELPILGARIDGAPSAFVDVAAWMDQELVRLRGLLDERQTRLLSEHLADDVAEHLHERIHTAREWVDRTARTTARCRTSSGMGVALRFREREEEQPGLARAIALLGKPPSLLADDERAELVAFLFERIEQARAADGDGPLERLLTVALDYRTWFRFELQVRMVDGALVPFTRRRKDVGSGGEREVLLHIPLLAAAAAVYDAAAPHAPRLIALDEAFNKVDEAGERGLLETIVALDLDFLLCGYDLWCAHPEVPAVEIYHLKRWDDHFGIVPLHRFRWDGQRTVELDPAA